MIHIDLFLAGWALAALLMLAAWVAQCRTADAGLVDVAWAAGLGLLAIGYALLAEGDPLRRMLMAIMAGGWSFRLAGYLLANRVIGQPEDGRYQRLRAHWREYTQLKFLGFFQAQALLTAIFAIPFLIVALTPERPPLLAVLVAVALWLLAVAGVWTLAMPLLLISAGRWDGMAETAPTNAELDTSGTANKPA